MERSKESDRRAALSGYLSVQIPGTVESQLAVRKVLGVFNFVANHSGPPAIPESELESVGAILYRGSGCSPHPFFQAGNRVRVVRGTLAGIEGIFMRRGAQSKLVIFCGNDSAVGLGQRRGFGRRTCVANRDEAAAIVRYIAWASIVRFGGTPKSCSAFTDSFIAKSHPSNLK
jgi:hypothetical protein